MHLSPGLLARSALAFALTFAVAGDALAQGLGCGLKSDPGATLLLPYFEVDLENPTGRTTLFAVGNAKTGPVLARATLWTNWGHPVLAFDLGIEAGAVRTFNLRDLIDGRLPSTEAPAANDEQYLNCTSPVTLPLVRADRLKDLLAGQPRLSDGLCYAEAIEGGRLLTGYLTVDIVNDCSGPFSPTPQDSGYFGDCASGLASNDNVLWGDFFLIDSEGNHAQGERLVSIVADQSRFGNDVCVDPPCGIRNSNSFWNPQGNRMPLPSAYEARFMNGGGFDGGTELITWVKGQIGPAACGSSAPDGAVELHLEARNERGGALGTHIVQSRLLTQRLQVGGEQMPLAEDFGCLGVQAPGRQLWIMPLMSAQNRFGVGLGATPVEDFCPF